MLDTISNAPVSPIQPDVLVTPVVPPTQEAPMTVTTELTHNWKGLPEYGNLNYEKKDGQESITVKKGEGSQEMSMSVVKKDGRIESFEIRLPAGFNVNVEYPDTPKREGRFHEPLNIHYQARTDRGGALPNYDSSRNEALPIGFDRVTRVVDGKEDVYTQTKTFGELAKKDEVFSYLSGVKLGADYMDTLTQRVLKTPIGGEPFDPTRDNATVECLTLVQEARQVMEENMQSAYNAALEFGGVSR